MFKVDFQEAYPFVPTSAGFCSIAILGHDKIYVQRGPQHLVDEVRRAINASWTDGLQKDENLKESSGVHKFKLRGFPWWNFNGDRFETSRLALGLMDAVRRSGFNMITDVDIVHRKLGFLRVWILREDPNDSSPPPDLCLALQGWSGVTAVTTGMPQDTRKALVASVKAGLETSWEVDSVDEAPDGVDISLDTVPWICFGSDGVAARQSILGALVCLEEMSGYRLTNTMRVADSKGLKPKMLFHHLPQETDRGEYVGLSFNQEDRIRLFGPPHQGLDQFLVSAISGAIAAGWPRGCARQQECGEAQEWVLKGLPFDAFFKSRVDTRLLLSHILQVMWQQNFEIAGVVEGKLPVIYWRRPEKASRHVEGPVNPVVGIMFNAPNKIRVTSTDQRSLSPVIAALREALQAPQVWKDVLREDTVYGRSIEFKLTDWPYMRKPVASNTEEAVKTVEDEVPKLDSDVDMTDAKVEQSVSGTDEKPDDHKSEKCEADKLPREVYLPPEPGLPVFSTAAPHHRPIAYDEYEDDNGVSRVAYLRSILLTQPVSVPPPMQFRMPVSGGETLLDEEERRRLAVKADGRRKEIRASSVLPYTMDFRKALAEYLEQRGIHLEVVHDLHSANRSEATSKGLPYRCTVYWYQQPNGGGRVDFDGGYQSDERVAVQAAAHAAITLKGIPLEEFLEKNCSEFGNLIIPATTARLRKMLELQEGGDDELIDFKVEERTVIDVGEERKGFQCKAKVAKWGEGVEVTGGWHISPLDAKYDCCQRVWSKIDAKEQAERDKIAAEKMAKERADREARMKEQLEKDREMREKLAKAQKEKLEKEREARIKAAPVRTSAVAANYSEKRQMSRPDGPGMAADNKRQ
ncbi:hypothetical protein FOL47_010183, partial [Perkinsus chesapeaki]